MELRELREDASIKTIVYSPQTEEGKAELAKRVAEAHAGLVIDTIDRLDCPVGQKLELLQAILDSVAETEW